MRVHSSVGKAKGRRKTRKEPQRTQKDLLPDGSMVAGPNIYTNRVVIVPSGP
jgi:hypothetical protein